MFHIVLHEPEIPQNTGNIARTCAATGCSLHIIEPIGFDISERSVRRAGLDYWDKVFVSTYPSFDAFRGQTGAQHVIPVSTRGGTLYHEAHYPKGAYMLFGKETAGLPAGILKTYAGNVVRLPMQPGLRSLNLSNAVAVMVYEALRQHGFPGLE